MPIEKEPPKHKMMAIFLAVTPFMNSYPQSIVSSLIASSFFLSIFSSMSLCLALIASGVTKSISLNSPSNISEYRFVFISSSMSELKPPRLQFKLGSTKDRFKYTMRLVLVLRQKKWKPRVNFSYSSRFLKGNYVIRTQWPSLRGYFGFEILQQTFSIYKLYSTSSIFFPSFSLFLLFFPSFFLCLPPSAPRSWSSPMTVSSGLTIRQYFLAQRAKLNREPASPRQEQMYCQPCFLRHSQSRSFFLNICQYYGGLEKDQLWALDNQYECRNAQWF